MKKLFTLLSFFMLLNSVKLIASYGYYSNCSTFVQFGSTTYKAGSCSSGDPALNGASLGTDLLTLRLNTIQQFTFQNGGDNVMSGTLHYRIYENGSPSGAYIALNLGTVDASAGGGNVKRSANPNTDLCASLRPSKTYVFDCYFQSAIDWNVNDGTANDQIYQSNGGANFKATFTTAFTLNADITAFFAKKQATDISISWQTASEQDNASFQIERSANAVDFSPIGEIKGAGNSKAVNNYTFTDVTPLSGINYYRLQTLDYFGKTSLSKIVAVNFTDKNNDKVSTYPNPAGDVLRLDVTALEASNTIVNVTDLAGRVLLSQNVSVNKGTNLLPLSISNLTSGMYLVKMNDTVVRFVKQ
jgi:Secretion system C-terminal sorting domain